MNIILFLALGISILLIKEFMDTSTKERKKNDEHTPDAYMVNAYYLRTNENGQRDVVLFAPHVTHYKYKDSSEFTKPQIYVYKNESEWRITSNKAKGLNGAATFLLTDDVIVRQLTSNKNTGTVILTKSLTVFPKENSVTTSDKVVILQPGMKISAIGLEGDLNSGNIKLLSKTRTQYDPHHF